MAVHEKQLSLAQQREIVANNIFQREVGLSKGRFYVCSSGVLYTGDCLDLYQHLKAASIDLIFADPPFNLNKNYGAKAPDNMTEAGYLRWCECWLDESIRVLKPGGALFVYNIPRWSIEIGALLNQKGMQFRHWIAITMKNTYPRGKSLYPAHYSLLYYTKGEPKVFNKLRVPIPICRHCGKDIKDYGGHRKKLHPEGLNLTDFWEDTSPVRHAKFKKRAANELKPVISKRAIEMASLPGDLVFDPFGGGGGTYSMAEETGRSWIGAEIETGEAILERLSEECWLEFYDDARSEMWEIIDRAFATKRK